MAASRTRRCSARPIECDDAARPDRERVVLEQQRRGVPADLGATSARWAPRLRWSAARTERLVAGSRASTAATLPIDGLLVDGRRVVLVDVLGEQRDAVRLVRAADVGEDRVALELRLAVAASFTWLTRMRLCIRRRLASRRQSRAVIGVVVLCERLAAALLVGELGLEAVDAHAQRGDPRAATALATTSDVVSSAPHATLTRRSRGAERAARHHLRSHATTVPEALIGPVDSAPHTAHAAARDRLEPPHRRRDARANVGGRSPIGRGRALKTPPSEGSSPSVPTELSPHQPVRAVISWSMDAAPIRPEPGSRGNTRRRGAGSTTPSTRAQSFSIPGPASRHRGRLVRGVLTDRARATDSLRRPKRHVGRARSVNEPRGMTWRHLILQRLMGLLCQPWFAIPPRRVRPAPPPRPDVVRRANR